MRYGYRHTAGVIIFILLFVAGCTMAFAQTSPNTPSGYSIDVTTGNLINNGGLTSMSGWTTSGMVGSPTPDGYIFSYASGTISQSITAANIPVSYQNTSAVFVTGISYGFQYRFQCAQSIGLTCETGVVQDSLNSTFNYYSKTGAVEYTRTYDLGTKNQTDGNPAYNPNWQSLAETYTFAGAKTLTAFGTATLSIQGADAGFWACNPDCYGPQVKNAYMTVNYSVDPCILNPAFNPSCPGFQNVVQGVKTPTFYHSYNIAQSLPHIGGGVVLHGYDYGFNWWNYGSCYNTVLFWCTDWRTDGGGTVNFRITDSTNNVLFANSWYREGNNSSGGYSSRYLFTESRNSLDMGRVDWWVTNSWNNFAVTGWTKPIWTPDPCYTNGLYSPNCTNFQTTLNQVIADVQEQQDRIAALTPTTSSSTATPGGTITTTVTANAVNPSVTVTTTPAVDTGSTSVVQESRSQSESTTGLALSLIRNNERREQRIAMQASSDARQDAAARADQAQKEAVATADSMTQLGQQTSDQAANQAQQMSSMSTEQSRSSSSSSSTTVGDTRSVMPGLAQQPTQTAAVVRFDAMREDQPVASTQTYIQESYSPVIVAAPMTTVVPNIESRPVLPIQTQENIGAVLPEPPRSPVFANNTSNTATIALPEPPQQMAAFRPAEPVVPTITPMPAPAQTMELPQQPAQPPAPVTVVEVPVADNDTATRSTNFTTNRTNPVTEIVEGRQALPESRTQTAGQSTVNRTVADNSLAGGVSIESIAQVPQGFNVYASLVLRDAAFYAPKEIYRGQRNIDNRRALSNLAQEGRHQEMVNQQYRR